MAWLKRISNALRAGRVEREIRRELEFHVAERADALRAGLRAHRSGCGGARSAPPACAARRSRWPFAA